MFDTLTNSCWNNEKQFFVKVFVKVGFGLFAKLNDTINVQTPFLAVC